METLGAYGWRKDASVEEGLLAEAHRFDFYQAVKLLEALAPERLSPGEEVDPSDQAVRFRSRVGLGFEATDVHAVEPPAEPGEPPTMAVNFLGLAGTQGPLPRHLAELILARRSKKDTAFADFLDIFNHRLIAMLYRARKKYRLALHWRPPEEARVSRPLFSLIGLGTGKLQGRMNVDDRSLLLYSGILARTARTMVGGERVLSHYFEVPVDIEPFVGAWIEISADETTRIGETGQNQVLGRTTVVGRRVWDQQVGYEIRVGPVDYEGFRDLLPTGTGFRKMWALAEFYSGHELGFRVRLTLEAAEVPELLLGAGGARAPRLGWTTWLKTEPPEDDDSQVVLTAASREAVAPPSEPPTSEPPTSEPPPFSEGPTSSESPSSESPASSESPPFSERPSASRPPSRPNSAPDPPSPDSD